MTSPHPASFRDPDGRVFVQEGRVFRAFTPAGAKRWADFEATGLPAKFVERGRMVESRRPADAPPLGESALVVEHPRVPFLTYAYEWSFEMLRAAGILQLDLALEAFASGWILKDATPYNVQFLGPRPVQIDTASFEPWKEGVPWQAHNQFCRLILNPLLLTALARVPFQPWLRGRIEGLTPEELSSLLPLRQKLRRGVFGNVALQAWLNRKFARSEALAKAAQTTKLRKEQVQSHLEGLRATLLRLKSGGAASHWERYEQECSVSPEALAFKDKFVERALAAARPAVAWDLGANAGRYSVMAARHAGRVVAFERDPGVVDLLYRRVLEAGLSNVLPVVMDLMDPSPGLGFEERERPGLSERGRSDFALCLALIHHLAISANLPIPRFLDWLARVTDGGVIEFVPKEDAKVQELLRWREDVFPDYTAAAFEAELGRRFRIVEKASLPGSARTLYLFARLDAGRPAG